MVFGMDFRDGLPGAIAVARDGCDRRRSVAHRVTGQAQTRHWILVVPAQQYPLDRVGMACASVALVALQIARAILNFRGVYKNEPDSGTHSGH